LGGGNHHAWHDRPKPRCRDTWEGRGMSTYIVTQDGARFEVRLDNASGQVIATFSNKLAAEAFAEKQRAIAQKTRPRTRQSDGNQAAASDRTVSGNRCAKRG
jgi:hypothetical protein